MGVRTVVGEGYFFPKSNKTEVRARFRDNEARTTALDSSTKAEPPPKKKKAAVATSHHQPDLQWAAGTVLRPSDDRENGVWENSPGKI